MTENSNAGGFGVRSRRVVEDFLQSVVVLDDRAWMGKPYEEPIGAIREVDYDKPPASGSDGDEEVRNKKAPSGVPLNAKAVIDGFAEIGLVCGVLNPTPQEDTSLDDVADDIPQYVVKAARRADIVVLDWRIGNYYGDVTIAAMRRILDDDAQEQRLRLIAIYTGERDLYEVSKRVRDTLDEICIEAELIADNPFRLSKGPICTVILAKEGTTDASVAEIHRQEVSETQLPDRLLTEFSGMTRGLLRNVALAGLSSLRNQVHRLLSKFDDRLDPAYLGHRLMLPNPPDAQDHVVDALGAEILSVLEDAQPGQEAAIGSIREWLSCELNQGLDVEQPLGAFWVRDNALEGLIELLELGRDGVEDCLRPSNKTWENVSEKATEIFARESIDPNGADHHFAALLGQRTRYQKTEPMLTLGTIIRKRNENGSDGRYFLCLQPKCDSIRLKSVTAFPLLPLVTRSITEGFSLVVKEAETGAWVRLDYSPKPNRLRMTPFKPGDYPPGVVKACCEGGGRYFRDESGNEYRWVADIKDEHALAVAAKVSNSLSRPGPNYAEWHRRAMPRL